MSLSHLPFSELLKAFRSSEPTPGGGSAAALGGAVGASLLAMVAGLPKPRLHEQHEAQRLTEAGARSAVLSERLTALMDADSEAYELVVAAYRCPKTTDEERQVRTIRIQEALRQATEAPLEVMRTCREALQLAGIVGPSGNRNASSDVHVAVELIRAGLRGAQLNVDVNLTSITDAAYVAAIRAEAERLMQDGEVCAAAAIGALRAPD
jgi:formiminotetrahydrofolate cyclodeaminase